MSERKKRLEKKLTMKMMDDDFNERTSFFRVVSPDHKHSTPRCIGKRHKHHVAQACWLRQKPARD